MALSKEQIDEILQARDEAINHVNAGGVELFFNCEENVQALTDLLNNEGVPREVWNNPRIFENAIIKARADGLLQRRLTQAEINARRERADRAAGSLVSNSKANAPAPTSARALPTNEEIMDRFGDKPKATPAPVEKVQYPTLDVDFEQMDQENRRLFMKLDAPQTRAWMKKRADRKHEQKFGSTPINRSVSAPPHVR